MPLRHDRRRRVLTDEAAGLSADVASSDGAAPACTEAYTPAARRERQPHLTDLVPRRYLPLGLWLVAGAVVIALCETLYACLPRIVEALDVQSLPPFDLAAPTSIATWFASLLLGCGALVSLVIYTLRRHRIDDYHGRYRVWLWAAMGLVMFSLDQTAGLHGIARSLTVRAGASGGLGESWLWGAICITVLGLCGLRLAIEMRDCRLALGGGLMAVLSLVTAAVIDQVWIGSLEPANRVMLEVGARLTGQLFVLWSIVAYARHVVLDAEGLLPLRMRPPRSKKRRVAREKKDAEESNAKTSIVPLQKLKPHLARTDLDEVSRTLTSIAKASEPARVNAMKPAPAPQVAKAPPEPDDEETGDDVLEMRGLTRAERKRLRREDKRKRAG